MATRTPAIVLTENRGSAVPAGLGYLYVGLDIGRRSHTVVAIPRSRMEDGSWERARTRQIASHRKGFDELSAWLASLGYEVGRIKIGIEPTGAVYARALVEYLERRGHQIAWLQNWAVHEKRQLLLGRQLKTDAVDARLIARLLFERDIFGLSRSFLAGPPQDATGLRMLVRNRLRLVGLKTRYRLQLTQILDMVFPELKDFVRGSLTTPAVIRLLQAFPDPVELAAADPVELRGVLVRICRAPRLAARAEELQALAAESAGIVDGLQDVLPTQRWLISQILSLEADLKDIDATIADSVQTWPLADRQVLESFPLISPWREAVLLSEIGDVRSFRSERQLRKLLGWYPEIVESGTSLSQHRLGLKGRRIARRELWLWSLALTSPLMPPTPFAAYYRRLVARGMAKPTALGHLAGKLVAVLFHCLKTAEPYDQVRHARQLGLKDVSLSSEAPTSRFDVAP